MFPYCGELSASVVAESEMGSCSTVMWSSRRWQAQLD